MITPTSAHSSHLTLFLTNLQLEFFAGVIFFGMPVLDKNYSRDTALTIEILSTLGVLLAATVSLVVLRVRHGGRAVGAQVTAATKKADRGGGGGADGGSSNGSDDGKRRNTLGLFQGIFFMCFMSSHIIGNTISGAILGDQKANPPHARVVRLFVVYSSLGLAGCSTIVLFLRRHSMTERAQAHLPQTKSNAVN